MKPSVPESGRILSTEDLMALRQCPRRLWLEVHRPERRQDAPIIGTGPLVDSQLAAVARAKYDPGEHGEIIDRSETSFAGAAARTRALLKANRPIVAPVFSAAGASACVDLLMPTVTGEARGWHAIEVIASTRIRDYRRDEMAIKAFVIRAGGVRLDRFSVTTVDSRWTYTGNGQFAGLLKEWDLSPGVFGRAREVQSWIARAAALAALCAEPGTTMGAQCTSPYRCGFSNHCEARRPKAEFPIEWLPGQGESKALRALRASENPVDMREVADDILTERQVRAKESTLTGRTFFDVSLARSRFSEQGFPATFLDFETIGFAVPRWSGLKPYQMVPFQFSVHIATSDGKLAHRYFLDLSGDDPTVRFATALLEACADRGPVYVYNAKFENAVIADLAARLPELANRLLAISQRSVDLLPIARDCYYHPSQKGSWSLKSVLPAIAPELGYELLEGVKNGGMAMDAYAEAVDADVTPGRKAQLQGQLLEYCKLDTLALVRLWRAFRGRDDALLRG